MDNIEQPMIQEEAKVVEQTITEQIPSVVKSHLPPHLQPRTKKPLAMSKDVNNAAPAGREATPSIVKRRQANKWFNSPTDTFLSPCTQKLWKPKHEAHGIEPLNLDAENEEHKQVSTEVNQS